MSLSAEPLFDFRPSFRIYSRPSGVDVVAHSVERTVVNLDAASLQPRRDFAPTVTLSSQNGQRGAIRFQLD
jgi:hypothetical protein